MPATIEDPKVLDEIGGALKDKGVGRSCYGTILSTSWPGLSRPSRFMGPGIADATGMAGTSPAMTWKC